MVYGIPLMMIMIFPMLSAPPKPILRDMSTVLSKNYKTKLKKSITANTKLKITLSLIPKS